MGSLRALFGFDLGANGGAFFFLRLPKSGIELDLPLIGQFPLDERPDAGLTPDVLVAATPDDIRTALSARLAAFKVPRRIDIVAAGSLVRSLAVEGAPAERWA